MERLHSARSSLERARPVLDKRKDAEGTRLRHAVRERLCYLNLIEEAGLDRCHPGEVEFELAKIGVLLDDVERYARVEGLRYFHDSGMPEHEQHDTRIMTQAQLWDAIGEMPRGATEPPPSVQAVIEEAQRLSVTDGLEPANHEKETPR